MMDDPICPVCKGDCSEFYFDCTGEIVGCNRCVTTRDAWEYQAEENQLQADFYRELFGRDE